MPPLPAGSPRAPESRHTVPPGEIRAKKEGRRFAPPPLLVSPFSSHAARFPLYPIVSRGGRGDPLHLEPEIQIVLRAVLVERARLILVQGVVLQGRIVEILTIQSDLEVLV